MEHVVIDTNCLIQLIPHRSKYNVLWQAIRKGCFGMCVSTEIMEEYEEIMLRLSNKNLTRAVMEAILNNPYTRFVTPYYKFNLIKADVDDNKFVDCAIIANAQFIVTEDCHYNVLETIPFPKVMTLGLEGFMSHYLQKITHQQE